LLVSGLVSNSRPFDSEHVIPRVGNLTAEKSLINKNIHGINILVLTL
jgi:hypothetical protein